MYAFFFPAFKPADGVLSMVWCAQAVQEAGMQPKQNVKARNTKPVSSALVMGHWGQHWPGVMGRGVRWVQLLSGRDELSPGFLPLLNQVRNALCKLTSNRNKSQGIVTAEA